MIDERVLRPGLRARWAAHIAHLDQELGDRADGDLWRRRAARCSEVGQ